MGLRTCGGPAVMTVGAKALPTAHAAIAAALTHATGRQRREGSEPVGKSSRTKTTSARPRRYIQPVQWPQARAAGNRSSSPMLAPAYDRPVADSSQPIGLAGRFHPSSAPTVGAKPAMNVTATVPASAFPAPPLRAGGSG